MRSTIFTLIGLILVVTVLLPVFLKKDANEDEQKDSLVLTPPPPTKDTTVIGSTCEFMNSLEWTKEDIEKFNSCSVVNGETIRYEPYIIIRGAERDLDTFVNYYNIYFTTEE